MSVLVCGGAGYIGSHTVRALLERGEDAVVVDSLRTGHRASVPSPVPFYEGDIRDGAFLDKVFRAHSIDTVVHFCACSLVGESVQEPLLYFNNNVYGMQVLLEAMVRAEVDRIVFSSSAAVYGEPKRVPICEDDDTIPTNPYGETKRIMERMMHWVGQKHGIRYVSLRYFNVAGAHESGNIGEAHCPESHLVPLILQVPLGRRDHVTLFGDDYPTPDGSCIRDYVHVGDLAEAHLLAMDHLRGGKESQILNLGSGDGYSVLEMIEAARTVTGHPVPVEVGARRAGDPARLVADSSRALAVLGWSPQTPRMEDIIASAWKWHRTHPDGFSE